MSAIAETPDGPSPLIQVLFTLHPGFDTVDFAGPLDVFSWARHNIKDPGKSLLPSISPVPSPTTNRCY